MNRSYVTVAIRGSSSRIEQHSFANPDQPCNCAARTNSTIEHACSALQRKTRTRRKPSINTSARAPLFRTQKYRLFVWVARRSRRNDTSTHGLSQRMQSSTIRFGVIDVTQDYSGDPNMIFLTGRRCKFARIDPVCLGDLHWTAWHKNSERRFILVLLQISIPLHRVEAAWEQHASRASPAAASEAYSGGTR